MLDDARNFLEPCGESTGIGQGAERSIENVVAAVGDEQRAVAGTRRDRPAKTEPGAGALEPEPRRAVSKRGDFDGPREGAEPVDLLAGVGDEYEIHLTTDQAGLDTMTLKVEHPNFATDGTISAQLASEMRTRCEVRVGVEVLSPGTLPKTEFKAARIKDKRTRQ